MDLNIKKNYIYCLDGHNLFSVSFCYTICCVFLGAFHLINCYLGGCLVRINGYRFYLKRESCVNQERTRRCNRRRISLLCHCTWCGKAREEEEPRVRRPVW